MDTTAPTAAPSRRPRLPVRFDQGWTLSDWVVGTTSVMLAVASAGFFATSYVISVRSPDYFQEAVLAGIPPRLDPITTGSVALDGALPAEGVRRAEDYQVVMVFDGEALLAAGNDLVRVRVGSVLPGIGTVAAIEPNAAGGTVRGDLATLQGLAAEEPAL